MSQSARESHTIAVLRGGDVSFSESLTEGESMLRVFVAKNFYIIDVLIDRDGTWTTRGIPTDPHYVFTVASFVVDTTHTQGREYHLLAKRMGVPILFSHPMDIEINREDVYRLLRQHDVPVPETSVLRASHEPTSEELHHIWNIHHTPLMVRPLSETYKTSGRVVKSFPHFIQAVEDYQAQGIDSHVLTYRPHSLFSVAVVPHFRNENMYISLPVKTVLTKHEAPTKHSHVEYVALSEEERKGMTEYVRTVAGILDAKGPFCIDVISSKGKYSVVNISTSPSLREGGRFLTSLRTTGADIAEYIASFLGRHESQR